jgi:hypothetical protein
MPPVRTTSESSSGLDIKSNEAVFCEYLSLWRLMRAENNYLKRQNLPLRINLYNPLIPSCQRRRVPHARQEWAVSR